LGIWDIFRRKKKEEKKPEEDPITSYELYECPPGGRWRKISEHDTEIDFKDIEDAKPAYTYKFCSRTAKGLIRSIWYEHMPGVEGPKVLNPFEELTKALGPMKEFGEQITKVRDDVRAAFGWAFPEKTGSEGSQIPPLQFKGDLPAYLHPAVPEILRAWSPVLGDMGKSIGAGIREGFTGITGKQEEKKESTVEAKRHTLSPDEWLAEQKKQKEGA